MLTSDANISERLRKGIHPLLLRTQERSIARVLSAWDLFSAKHSRNVQWLHFLRHELESFATQIDGLKRRCVQFNSLLASASTQQVERDLILDFARFLGASEKQLQADRRAFGRWFGADAVNDRYARRLGEEEQHTSFLLVKYGFGLAEILTSTPADDAVLHWRAAQIEFTLGSWLRYSGDARVRVAAAEAFREAILAGPVSLREELIGDELLNLVFKTALDATEPTWVQTAHLDLLAAIVPRHLVEVIQKRFNTPRAGDDIFVRRHCVGLLRQLVPGCSVAVSQIAEAARDPSPLVRQGAVELLKLIPSRIDQSLLSSLVLEDSASEVRGFALQELPGIVAAQPHLMNAAIDLIERSLAGERVGFVQRLAMESLVTLTKDSVAESDRFSCLCQRVCSILEQLHTGAENLGIRRCAAQALEELWLLQSSPRAQAAYDQAAKALSGLMKTPAIVPCQLNDVAQDELGRILSLLAQAEFPLAASGVRDTRLARGFVFRFRTWRWWHELNQSATDKRQSFRHTIGRVFNFPIQARASALRTEVCAREAGVR